MLTNLKVSLLTHAVVGIVAFVVGFSMGGGRVQKKWDADKAKASEAQTSMLLLGIHENFKLGLQYAEREQEVRYVTREVIRQIPVQMPDTRTCPVLPAGFGGLHNQAAAGPANNRATGTVTNGAR